MIAMDSQRTKKAYRSPLTCRQAQRGGYGAGLEGASIGDLQAIGLARRTNKGLQVQAFGGARVYWLSACYSARLR